MTFREALDRKPADLTHEHETVARILIGNPEGVTRKEAEHLSGFSDRKFRKRYREIAAAQWLPTVSTNRPDGTHVYKIAGPGEGHLINANNSEDHSRSVKLNQCAKGRLVAFQRMHSAGPMFLDAVPDLEATP